MSKSPPKFTKKLIIWYLDYGRNLPWRETKDPYRIWLSEIILQQTRVAQGLPYFERFVDRFPNVFDLAGAEESEVLKLWQGLGYYSRARNLHHTAQAVTEKYDGVFPSSYHELMKLKGVGDYTASAIASICFDEPTAVVDGNVFRVLSRVFGIDTPINSTKGFQNFKQLAQQLLDPEQPGTFNQALMEFGARHCVPSNPDCGGCIFKEECVAFKRGKVGELPVKEKKNRIRIRYFNYLVFVTSDGKTLVEKRSGKGIWQNLFQFPLIESDRPLTPTRLKKDVAWSKWTNSLNILSVVMFNDDLIVHKLSHQHLKIRFWIVEVVQPDERFIGIEELHEKPVPIALANFISQFSLLKL